MAASMAGFKFLRKVVVIDDTQMKGKYKSCLVAASGQDGNMQIYPLAFGVVDSENEKSWEWFFENLLEFVPDEAELVFVSDRYASIYAALRKVYPLVHHAACTVHLWRNIRACFTCEGLANIVSKAARTYTVGDFCYWWAEIEKRSPPCARYLLDIGLSHWTLSHFQGDMFNIMSCNISESLNNALKKAIDFHIATMLEFLRTMLMKWFCYRRAKTQLAETQCTPEIESILVDHLKEAIDCGVLFASYWIYQVNDASGCAFTVDLEKMTCTYRVFDVLKIPCCHALAARKVRSIGIYTLVGSCYSVFPWFKLYEQVIMPLPKAEDVDIPLSVTESEVNPPQTRRSSDRPRKVRLPS